MLNTETFLLSLFQVVSSGDPSRQVLFDLLIFFRYLARRINKTQVLFHFLIWYTVDILITTPLLNLIVNYMCFDLGKNTKVDINFVIKIYKLTANKCV